MLGRLTIAFCAFAGSFVSRGAERPNIVFILTDNQGAWQLGCYGNPEFQTPNIDRLAAEGVKFTRAFANNAVCSPTRATYLTGLTPSQHGVHRYLGANGAQIGPNAYNTIAEFDSLPEILSENGYACGLSGKWHLGDNLHPQDGFTFWVTKPHGHSKGFLNQEIIENGEIRKEPKHLSEYWTDRGIEFIEANHERPFFLMLAYNGPYSLSGAMLEPVPSPWSDPYRDHELLKSFPRPEKAHPWQRNQQNLIGNIEAGRNLAGQVTAVDAGVGRILEALTRLDLETDTLVVYAADQGAVAGHAGFWGMGDHTTPLHGRDGTSHIPMIFRLPGKIPAGVRSERIVTNYDFLPSLLSYLGLPMPEKPKSPGRDFSPVLRGGELESWDDVLFFEFENVRAIRTPKFKYVERKNDEPARELFDLEADPDELANLIEEPKHAVLVKELKRRLDGWFAEHADPRWDVWNGGTSKSGLMTAGKLGVKNAGPKFIHPGSFPGEKTPRAGHRKVPGNQPQAVVPETDHSLNLLATEAFLYGDSVKINTTHRAAGWWKSPNDRAVWEISGAKNGTYAVVLEYALTDECAGQPFRIGIEGEKEILEAKATTTGGWGKYQQRIVGEIEITKPDFKLAFHPAAKVRGPDLLDLRAVILIPSGSPRIAKIEANPTTVPTIHLFAGKPKQVTGNQPPPVSAGEGGIFKLNGAAATLFGNPITLLPNSRAIGGWTDPGHRAEWELKGIRAGKYDLLVDWAMPDVNASGQKKVQFLLDRQPLSAAPIRTTGGADRFARYVIGTVELPAGDHRLSFGPQAKVPGEWVRLRSLHLVPAMAREFTIPPLTVPEGFTIEPAALPPLVNHPMLACLDDRGRMFISESAGTNAKASELLETHPHKILMLEDDNGDGVYDRSTVFADNLVLPNGAQWHNGALYVCSPPFVWRFRDTDDDGKADEKTPITGKFGFNGMSSAFHGPILGPDGRLYWCGGQHGWTLGDTTPGFDLNGPWTSKAPGVFSMWPDGSDPENRAQGGMANPVEVAFTPEGEVLGTVAVYDQVNGRHDAVLHWLPGAVYNLRKGREPIYPRTSDTLLPPVSRRGWVAPPGIMRYRSGATGFGEEYADNFFLAEFNTHRVYRLITERKGASFVSRDEIFLESSSPYTHFTDVFEDADGSLLVVDTGGWFLYGCPTSAIERPDIRGAIYRVRKTDAKKLDEPWGPKLGWPHPNMFVGFLDDERFAVRDLAIYRLADYGQISISPLAEAAKNGKTTRLRRNAIWALTRIHELTAREAVRAALDDPDFSVRLTATRSIATHRDEKARDRLLELVVSDEPAIRREAATALGRIGDPTAVPALLKSLETTEADRFLEHALIFALIRIDEPDATLTGLDSEHATVRRGALVALDGMKTQSLTPEMVIPLLADSDPDLHRHAAGIVARHPDWAEPMLEQLKQWIVEPNPDAERVELIQGMVIAFKDNHDIQSLASLIIEMDAAPLTLRAAVIRALGRSELDKAPPWWRDTLLALVDPKTDPALLSPAIESLGRLSIPIPADRVNPVVADPRIDPEIKVAAITASQSKSSSFPDSHFALLLAETSKGIPAPRRVAAARALALTELNEHQRPAVAKAIRFAGPLEINLLLDALAGSSDEWTGHALAASLNESPGFWSVSPVSLRKLLASFPESVRSEAGPLLAKLEGALAERDSRLTELEANLGAGDADRGKAAYTKATCIVCHKVRGEGGAIGPDLTTIGGIRTTRDLLESIVFPSATFAREYEPFTVSLRDGQSHFGRIGGESPDAVYLVDATGAERKLPRSAIETMEMAPVSLMPPGLDRVLSAQELSDLIAFLRSLK